MFLLNFTAMNGLVLLEALNNDGTKSGTYNLFEKESADKMIAMKNAKWVLATEKKKQEPKRKPYNPSED